MNLISNRIAAYPLLSLPSSFGGVSGLHPTVTPQTRSSRLSFPAGLGSPICPLGVCGVVVSTNLSAVRHDRISTERSTGMARTQRFAAAAVEQALEAQLVIAEAHAYAHQILDDDVVTTDEARRLAEMLASALIEARDVVELAERADVSELAAGALMTTGGIGRDLSYRMRACGITLPDNVLQFPKPSEHDAA